jgi:hypothetical protein
MGAVARIVELLQGYPDLDLDVLCGIVTVKPRTSDGFTVSLTEREGACVVGFGGWHEHFTSEDAALERFAFGLSDQCRLRISYRGECPYCWTLEERIEGVWRAVGTSRRIVFPVWSFWRSPRVEYHQNAVFNVAESGAAPGRGDT